MKDSIAAYSKEKSIVKKALKDGGFENVSISNGYYYFSGFATKNGKVIYFSCSDVRHFKGDRFLIRKAAHYKDYTGETNNWCKQNVEEFLKLANQLVS